MIYGSVCSGIEAATVAWHPLGWRAAFYSEIEAFPCAVLNHYYPDTPNRGDMTKFKEWPDATVDLLVGGTPCQSFSVAGLRKGLADPRGNLTLTYLALADQHRARWVVWENVPGVLSDGTGAFGAFLGGLAKLGYGFAYRVLDAQYFGVPQRRRRVFVVGCLGDWRRAAAVLFERASLQGNPAPSREQGQRVARPIAAGSQRGSGYRNDADTADNLMVAHSLRADGFDASEDGTGRGTPIVPITFQAGAYKGWAPMSSPTADDLSLPLDATRIHAVAFAQNQREEVREMEVAGALPSIRRGDAKNETLLAFSSKDHGADAGELAPTLRAMGHSGSHANAGGQVAVAFQASQSGMRLGEAHATLDSHNGSRRHQGALVGMQVRRLTPRECERLQGFKDDYTLVQYRGKPAADGPRYKALGNSMAVPVMRWIGERIAAVDAL